MTDGEGNRFDTDPDDDVDPEAWRSPGIIPQYPGADHMARFHAREGDWRTPMTLGAPACDAVVNRLLASALATALGVGGPAELGALHGAAYDLVHDAGIADEVDAREQLVSLIERMAGVERR